MAQAEYKNLPLQESVKQNNAKPPAGAHWDWLSGFKWASGNEDFIVKLGGKFAADTGNLDPDDTLDSAFPDLSGYDAIVRTATLSVSGSLFRFVDFKLEYNAANPQDIQDNWIRLKSIRYLGNLQIGHFKEPFSLEREGSINHRTFMENSLPTQAFSPGRNMGVMLFNQALGDRLNWKIGAFYNARSFSTSGSATDKISPANGYDITARIVARPWHSSDGKQLLHLGLSYNHGFREDDLNDADDRISINTRPETRLTDIRLVDTGKFPANRIDNINIELAGILGPFSLQGEGFYSYIDTGGRHLSFSGYYLQGSAVLTGENRKYNSLKGVFNGITPNKNFDPFHGGWGAWELAARLSYVDLNDGSIKGGEELNLTAGLNGYLRPNVRIMINCTYAELRNRKKPLVDKGRANILQARFQIFF